MDGWMDGWIGGDVAADGSNMIHIICKFCTNKVITLPFMNA